MLEDSTIRLTAFEPPPPTPITLIIAELDGAGAGGNEEGEGVGVGVDSSFAALWTRNERDDEFFDDENLTERESLSWRPPSGARGLGQIAPWWDFV